MKNKKYVIYVKKSFVTIKTRKKSEIIVITLENVEELLIANAHGAQYERLMIQEIHAIFIGERIVLKSFVKI